MGTFEKLGILVIVVIIVMIMAVAIYQWGGPESQLDFGSFASPGAAAEKDPPLEVDYLPVGHGFPHGRREPAEGRPAVPDTLRIPNGNGERRSAASTAQRPAHNRRGIPEVYVVESGDILWKVVVQKWKLSDRFLRSIQQANPTVSLAKVTPGMRLRIPDPTPYFRVVKQTPGKRARTSYRTYRVQEGDDLWHISRKHLGSAMRYKEILRLNPGISPKRLRAGQILRLPPS
ncbi:MAG: LysM peptidoglycan-binding domain-containing protein [Planctomycetota bacterium]|nr:LysM peptidoglycan-binding domain-containing protein [Planctomycetota bacterium]